MAERSHPPGREPAGLGDFDGQHERAMGGAIVSRLHGVLRGMRLYDPSNRALRAQQQSLLEAVQALANDEVSLLGMGEYFYVNGIRLRPDGADLAIFRSVLAEFEVRHLGGLRFSSSLKLEELETFLRIFHAERTDKAAAALEAGSARSGVRNIGVIRVREAAAQAPAEAIEPGVDIDRHRTRLVFRRATTGTRDLLQRTARTGRPALQQARRVVQPIVDRLLRRESSLIGLTALKHHDEYTFVHCVNVSILSIRMGQVLGLTRAELAAIGVAALLHDTGKIAVPAEVLRKPGQLDAEEWVAIKRHPMEGLRIVSRLPSISELMLDSMRVAFEHHMNVDRSGYPAAGVVRGMGSFARIVAVADVFDAVTAHRAYRKRPMTAHEALRLLLGREREHFDPVVLWALAQTVGLYPAGTLMRSDSGRLLLSIHPNLDDPQRPVCRELLLGPDGTISPAPVSADAPLGEHERVTHVLAPEEVEVNVESLLAA
jgi:HD-GYP domain-containing protein (c-di-GMP phosphodiesterase class II)